MSILKQDSQVPTLDNVVDFASAGSAPERFPISTERLIAGQPVQTIWNHYSSPCGRFSAGVWACTPGHWRVHYSEFEYCEILSGHSVLHDRAGGRRALRPGDRFVIPAGFDGAWEVIETTRKHYVIFEPNDSG